MEVFITAFKNVINQFFALIVNLFLIEILPKISTEFSLEQSLHLITQVASPLPP